MSMKVKMIDSGNVYEYEDNYALRLIEQGKAIFVSGDTPVTPDEPVIDPSQYGEEIQSLKDRATALETTTAAQRVSITDVEVFGTMQMTITQAEERLLEYNEEVLQEEIDALADDGEE